MAFRVRFNEEKDQILQATRGIGFTEAIKHLRNGDLLADRKHSDPKKSHQRMYIIQIEQYAYVIPYVIDTLKEEIFLKTVYPSRKFTKQYIRKEEI